MKPKPRQSFLRRHETLAVALILYAAAFTIRLVYLNEIRAMPTFEYPVMDEKYHLELARQINSKEGLPHEPYFRAPLYPYSLAFVYKATGNSIFWTRFVQILIASLLPILILLLGLKLFNKTVAYVAGAIAALYPTFIYYDSTLLITFLEVLLTVLLVLQLYRCQAKPDMGNFVLSGILLGLAGLARPNFLLLGPALFIWLRLVLKPKIGLGPALLRYVIMGLVCMAAILPVTVRNFAVSGDFVPIAWQGGFNFYVGNNRYASGWSATVPGIDPSWEGGYKESIAIAETNVGRQLRKSEVSDYWYGKATGEIIGNPIHFAGLVLKKVLLFINGYEIPNNQHIYIVRVFSPVMKLLLFDHPIFFPYGLLVPLGIIGFAISLRDWRKYLLIYLFVGAYVLSFLLFFVCARFRQPVVPLLILFAVWAVYKLVGYFGKRRIRETAVFLGVFALLFVESNHYMLDLRRNRIEADCQYFLGSAYLTLYKMQQARPDVPLTDPLPDAVVKARGYFKRAVHADTTFAMAYNDLGTIELRRQRWRDAEQYLLRAQEVDSTRFEPYLNYAMLLGGLGRVDEAGAVLEKASQRFPFNESIFFHLGRAFLQLGEREKARVALSRCLQINPNNTDARRMYDLSSRNMPSSPSGGK